ncbi:MAG: alpha/beta fold hydrolase [Alphaproteobacteria bacterium]|nr:alpha/beta fold hydrolase [Alphaproteobacteria bacterium]
MPTLGGKQLWGDVLVHAGYRIQRHIWTKHHRLLSPADLRLAWGSFEACRDTLDRLCETHGIAVQSRHLVLLLHGIFRSKDAWGPMVRALRADGYEAHAINYPSTRQSLEQHADQVQELLDNARDVDTVSFVTHSMGGIVARVLLARTDAAWRQRIAVNRLVMIATPNKGAEMALRVDEVGPFRMIGGPSLAQMRPEVADRIPLPTVPFGVVAGVRGDGKGYNPLIAGDDDMTVSASSALLEGAEDRLVVNAVHTFVMIHPAVIRATLGYLRTGCFGASSVLGEAGETEGDIRG